jgi:hypothetical protein
MRPVVFPDGYVMRGGIPPHGFGATDQLRNETRVAVARPSLISHSYHGILS